METSDRQALRAAEYERWTSLFEAHRATDEHGWSIRERCDQQRFLLGIFLSKLSGCSLPDKDKGTVVEKDAERLLAQRG